MNIAKTLSAGTVFLNLKSTEKFELIAEMVDRLVEGGYIKDRETVLAALYEREHKMSTGMQYGIAIPHAKTAGVDSLVAAVGIHRQGIDFGSLDGQPAHIFIMAISSLNRTGPHIQFLAEISRLLNDETVRQKLLQVKTIGEVLELLRS